jgi:ubiquinone/menaquinone biosynthesis C-methylase UbiE
MLWKSVLRILEPHRQELTSRLTAAENRGPGRLELNPNLQLPDYYTATEFHIMPGSYHTDEIAGWVFEIGGSIYFNNAYDANAMQMAIVESLPAGFVPTKILDVGCSTGTSTTVWKETFPQADVTGIDLAAPMLRYGHLKAMELGLDVTFSQRLAEDTGYPDNSFDLVTACILTHELPTSAVRAFFREAFRILKAGGLLLNGDIPPLRAMPGGSSMGILRHDFEKYNNGEAYIPEILGNGQLPDLMREAGFRAVTEPATPHKRTGQTFPWITYGWK